VTLGSRAQVAPVALSALAVLSALAASAPARAQDPPSPPPVFSDGDILGQPPPYFRIEAFNVRYTHFDQSGTGYQSRAATTGGPGSELKLVGPKRGPGSEWATIEQPQAEIIARQGDRITHRIWIPVDIVTAASADAIDAVSTASRMNEAGSIDWTITYKADDKTNVSVRNGIHYEENWVSWNAGFGFTRSFLEDNTTVEAGVTQVNDWFDKYTLAGAHDGHTARSTTTLTGGVTQLLSPTTIAHADYGFTYQRGQLSNGWNIVPLTNGSEALEIVPKTRVRHALMGKVAQFLPWNGAAHASYRFYADDWGIFGHTMELELYQRLSRISYVRFNYRFHRQSGADFFTTRAAPTFTVATADSDLAALDAHTFGVKGSLDLPVRFARTLHADLAVERYFRTNDLRVSVYSCGLGFLF
jgi:hypothetical protein